MSRVRADKLVDRAGTGAVELTQGATLPSGKTISGSGTIAVNSSGTAAGLSGSPDITVNNITGVAATFSGVLTYDDVTNVDSIGLVTARSLKVNAGGINVIGGGATVTGVTTFFNDIRVKGVIENVSAATTFLDATGKVVLELDLLGSTTYSYAMQPANIGVVSFKNMPADAQGGATVTVLFTQASATTGGVGNTTFDVGLGTDCTVIPLLVVLLKLVFLPEHLLVEEQHLLVSQQLQEIKSLFHSSFTIMVEQILMPIVTTFSLQRTDSLDLVS